MMDNIEWVKQFKSAILTKNIENVRTLIEAFPSLNKESIDTKKEVLGYLKIATNVLKSANYNLADGMHNIRLRKKLNQTLQSKNNKFISKYI